MSPPNTESSKQYTRRSANSASFPVSLINVVTTPLSWNAVESDTAANTALTHACACTAARCSAPS
eukprot:3715320-Prymnesium_polylepis.4